MSQVSVNTRRTASHDGYYGDRSNRSNHAREETAMATDDQVCKLKWLICVEIHLSIQHLFEVNLCTAL